MKARDGTLPAPKRAVVSFGPIDDGLTVLLECGDSFKLPADSAVKESYRCVDCVRNAPPPGPPLTTAEKRLRKSLKISPYEHVLLIALAHGKDWPTREDLGGNSPSRLVVLLRDKGYVLYDPDFFKQAGSRAWDSSVNTPIEIDITSRKAKRAIAQGAAGIAKTGNCLKLRSKKGGDLSELPEELRVRQFPTPRV